MFYTSVWYYFSDFSIFLSSTSGGTQALGGLVANALMMAMLANLILLPSLTDFIGKIRLVTKKRLKNQNLKFLISDLK